MRLYPSLRWRRRSGNRRMVGGRSAAFRVPHRHAVADDRGAGRTGLERLGLCRTVLVLAASRAWGRTRGPRPPTRWGQGPLVLGTPAHRWRTPPSGGATHLAGASRLERQACVPLEVRRDAFVSLAALAPSLWKQTGEWPPTCAQRFLCGLCHFFAGLQRSGESPHEFAFLALIRILC